VQKGARGSNTASAATSTGSGEAHRLHETCHDMRQAIGGVFALAGAALAEPGLPESTRGRLEQIVGQAQWLADMVRDYLGADERPGSSPPLVDLTVIADEAVAAERVTYVGELELARPPVPVLTQGNRVTIRRIIANLLSNATRAAGPLGRVRIEIGYDQNRALLAIDDSGPGFGRIQEVTGLGLCAVVRSVGECQGRLEYGRGSLGGVCVRLWLLLPAGWAQPSRITMTGRGQSPGLSHPA
jgi:K+-sensing histidine kinase KdpD